MVSGLIFVKFVLVEAGFCISLPEDFRSNESNVNIIGISGFALIENSGTVIKKESVFYDTRQLIPMNIMFNVERYIPVPLHLTKAYPGARATPQFYPGFSLLS